MKPCLIHHPAGIGDIFYLQSVARKYISMGYDVVWPIKDKLMWMAEYIPDINFVSENSEFPLKQYWGQDAVIATPQYAYLGIMRPHLWGIGDSLIMSSKYSVLGWDSDIWRDNFKYNRNKEKEDELYYNVLGLSDDSEYVYVNQFYNTENKTHELFDEKVFDYPIVLNQIIDGFTPFDWCKVFENAKEIYTRPTSISFIIDTLKINAKVYYYTFDKENYDQVHYIFNNFTEYISND